MQKKKMTLDFYYSLIVPYYMSRHVRKSILVLKALYYFIQALV